MSSCGQYGSLTFPNGQSRTFTYDNQARLTNVTNRDISGGVLASFDYGYDLDWPSNTYSMLGQRTSVNVSATPGTILETGLTKYQYDSRYQLTHANRPSNPYDAWTYDAIGNRTSSQTATYSYYKNGQNTLNGQRLRSLGSLDYSYDAAGNLTGYVTSPNMYTWDYAGRLTSALGTSFTYDYLGRRTTLTTGGSTTRYISLGTNTVGERNATTGVSTDYVFGPGIDEPLAKRTADGSISYYGVDGLGSVVVVTDANATLTNSASYDAWGTRGGGGELFGYTSRETGGPFSFFRSRYYDSGTGRFISGDLLGAYLAGNPVLSSHLHRTYIYADNAPILRRDPLGLDSCGPLPPCGGSVPCSQCCAQRFQFALCGLQTTFRYSHVYEALATVAGIAAGGRVGLGGAVLGGAIGFVASYSYLHYAEIAAEQAVRNEYQHCADQCMSERDMACNVPQRPPTQPLPASRQF